MGQRDSWNEANTKCRGHNGHLISINSFEEFQVISDMIMKLTFKEYLTCHVFTYIGLMSNSVSKETVKTFRTSSSEHW